MKLISPILGGIAAGAQLSTADVLMSPSSATDFGLSGAVSSHFLLAVPLGALMGSSLCWYLAGGWKKSETRGEFWRSLAWAVAGAFVVAPMAPAMLGLNATPAQMKQGLAVLSLVCWACLGGVALLERRGAM